MSEDQFPVLDPGKIAPTRDALHAYAKVLGNWSKTCQAKRKHWWHASLRPSLRGLTTGPVFAGRLFELELDLRASRLRVSVASGGEVDEPLHGQPASELSSVVSEFLLSNGVEQDRVTEVERSSDDARTYPGYSPEQAYKMAAALSSVGVAMQRFRADIREETSPIQLWPHHFDLSLVWLPGTKVLGQDPSDEEYADKQMNFGFGFGDESITAPYFYITAYPFPAQITGLPLPVGAGWEIERFNGALLHYEQLSGMSDPQATLLGLWHELLTMGRRQLGEIGPEDTA